MTVSQEEAEIKRQIRSVLRLISVPCFRVWQGQFSQPGVSDLIAVIPPSGRLCAIEVKVPNYRKNTKTVAQQEVFLSEMRAAGALAFFAWTPGMVVEELAAAGYIPAQRAVLLTARAR